MRTAEEIHRLLCAIDEKVAQADPEGTVLGLAGELPHTFAMKELRAAVEKLPERERRALVMSLCGASFKDIAAILGITDRTALNDLTHALVAVEKDMTEQH